MKKVKHFFYDKTKKKQTFRLRLVRVPITRSGFERDPNDLSSIAPANLLKQKEGNANFRHFHWDFELYLCSLSPSEPPSLPLVCTLTSQVKFDHSA